MENLLEQNTITVELYDPSREEDWNEYVKKSPMAVLDHILGWKSVVEETYGHQAFYLMAYHQGCVVGILPLFLIKSLIFGKFLVTSPYLSFGGIVCDNEEAATALVDEAKQIARDHQVDYMEIRNQKHYQCLDHTKTMYCTMTVDLTIGEDKLWKAIPSRKTRQSVNKARRSGLEIVKGYENLDTFVDLHAQSMRRLGTPDHSKNFFYNIRKYLPKSELFMVRYDQRFIAGMILVEHKDTVHMPWNACLQEYFIMQPNNLMYWDSIVRACRGGFRFLDFGRSKFNSGTFLFKASFAAQPRKLYYQYYLNRAREVPNIDPNNSKFKPLISVWKKLPISLLKTIGPWIIRDIP